MNRLKRLVPRPVIRALKALRINPLAGGPRPYRSRLARERAAQRTDGAVTVAPPPPLGDADTAADIGQPERARTERRAVRLRAQLTDAAQGRRDAIRQRDDARETLAGVRSRLRKLEQQVRFPEEAWWEQRAQLAGWAPGEGLRDFSYFPGGTQNPYLRMLYARLPEEGYDPRPLARFDHINRLPPASVFHLHWTRIAQLGAETIDDAQAKSDDFLDTIAAFVERGGTFVWSVHEALPHDCPFPEVEQDLRQHLADLAHGVHVLHRSTIDEVAPYYTLPEDKVFVVEHPLYTGIYETYLTRAAARRLIGLGDDEVMILGFGAIRPYKGFDRLVRVLPRLRKETGRDVRVVVAGPTMQSIDNSELEDLVADTEGASITGDPIPDEYVQVMFKSADIVALPYRQVLNSGVLMLGLTFGCSSIAPDNAVTRDTLDSGLVRLFDRTDEEDLYRVLVEAVDDASPATRRLPEAFADRYDPATIAGDFAAALHRIVAP
jgi:glycosyltransferase involved in cell wall biosynthesis